MIKKQLFVISTGQHVGKTTISMGLMNYLKNIKSNTKLAYCKPVGQQHVSIPNSDLRVDKDSYLFKEYFNLDNISYKDTSPVIFTSDFTKNYLDYHETNISYNNKTLLMKVKNAHDTLVKNSDFLVCEGTGHTGVGSICEINNAQVANHLDINTIIITRGGLGSSFDELALNRQMLLSHNVNIKGVILNKVHPTKLEMIENYYTKALQRWNIPLLGCIPQLDDLCQPTMEDYSKLLKSKILTGNSTELRYFKSIRLALAPVDSKNLFKPIKNQLVITHSGRTDVLDAVINNQGKRLYIYHTFGLVSDKMLQNGENLESGLILTGWDPPSPQLLSKLENENIPCIYVNPKIADSYHITSKVSQLTAKISRKDVKRLSLAIDHINKYVHFKDFIHV